MLWSEDAIPRYLRANLVAIFFQKKNGAAFGGDYVKNHPQQYPGMQFLIAQRADGPADLQQGIEVAHHPRRLPKGGERVRVHAEKFVRLKLERSYIQRFGRAHL